MSEKFWATLFTIALAIVTLVLKHAGTLDLAWEIALVAAVGAGWLWAIARGDSSAKREKEDKRGARVFQESLHPNTQDRWKQRPAADQLDAWRAAGMPERFNFPAPVSLMIPN